MANPNKTLPESGLRESLCGRVSSPRRTGIERQDIPREVIKLRRDASQLEARLIEQHKSLLAEHEKALAPVRAAIEQIKAAVAQREIESHRRAQLKILQAQARAARSEFRSHLAALQSRQTLVTLSVSLITEDARLRAHAEKILNWGLAGNSDPPPQSEMAACGGGGVRRFLRRLWGVFCPPWRHHYLRNQQLQRKRRKPALRVEL